MTSPGTTLSAAPADASRSLELEGLQVSTAFTAGAGVDLRQLSDGTVRLTIPPDPDCRGLPGYDYVFCLRIANGPHPGRVTVEARMPEPHAAVPWAASRVPIFVSDDFRTWYVLDHVAAAPTQREFRFTIDLAAGETVYCSNSLPCPSASMAAWLDLLTAADRSRARIASLGSTVHGRPIPVVTIDDPTVPDEVKDRVLVTSGFHPAEPDWLASVAIIEALVSDSVWAREMRRHYVFDIVPQVNPDGFDLGTNASNAYGVNLYWDFRRADASSSPEAVALWQWIVAHPPDLYVDYHAYVYQLQKDYRPYLRPVSEYPAAARPAVRALDRAFVARCEGRGVRGAATSDPLSLAPQLTAHFGTITYPKFHMHLYHGVDACRRLGLDVLRSLLAAAEPWRPLRARTGRTAWTPGRLDRLRTRAAQSRTVVRARNVLARLAAQAGGRRVREAVAIERLPGLPAHWSGHFWRDRPRSTPVIRVGDSNRTGA